MQPHIFGLTKTAFVLWRPQSSEPAPTLIIGRFQPGNPPTLAQRREIALKQITHPDLWTVDAADCGLTDGQVYHYWFEVNDSSPFGDGRRILCTDPTAFTVDWRLCADRMSAPYGEHDQDPAAVVKFEGGQLVPCDPGGERYAPARPIARTDAAPNARMVVYSSGLYPTTTPHPTGSTSARSSAGMCSTRCNSD